MSNKSIVLRRVDLGSLFKMAFIIYATLGFVVGLFFGLMMASLGSLGAMLSDDVPGFGFLSGAIGIVAMPFLAAFYGIMGSIIVTLVGALYNFAARFVGGLKISVDVGDTAAPPSAATPTSP